MIAESGADARLAFAPRGTLRDAERVRAGAEFRLAYDTGRSLHGRSIVLFCVRRDTGGRRVGFVTGRKVGGAVVRNRVRRCLREAYRAVRDEMPVDLLLVCVARKGADIRGAAALAQEMRLLLTRLDSPELPRPPRPPRPASRPVRSAKQPRGGSAVTRAQPTAPRAPGTAPQPDAHA